MKTRLAIIFVLVVAIILLFVYGAPAQVYFSSPPNIILNYTPTAAQPVNANFARIVSDGNTAFNNFSNQITSLSTGGVPSGAIVAFNLGSCPTGWVTADGTNSTPDMRGYFARVTAGSPAYGTVQSFQETSHVHTVNGTFIYNYTQTSQNFNSGGAIRMLSLSGSTVGNMSTGNSAAETRPKNVALRYCMKQ